jgi:hypothetical protein
MYSTGRRCSLSGIVVSEQDPMLREMDRRFSNASKILNAQTTYLHSRSYSLRF